MNPIHILVAVAFLATFGIVGEMDYQDELIMEKIRQDQREIARQHYERHGVLVE